MVDKWPRSVPYVKILNQGRNQTCKTYHLTTSFQVADENAFFCTVLSSLKLCVRERTWLQFAILRYVSMSDKMVQKTKLTSLIGIIHVPCKSRYMRPEKHTFSCHTITENIFVEQTNKWHFERCMLSESSHRTRTQIRRHLLPQAINRRKTAFLRQCSATLQRIILR